MIVVHQHHMAVPVDCIYCMLPPLYIYHCCITLSFLCPMNCLSALLCAAFFVE